MALIYNPLAWNITTIITFTVDFSEFSVTDHLGNPVPPEVGVGATAICASSGPARAYPEEVAVAVTVAASLTGKTGRARRGAGLW